MLGKSTSIKVMIEGECYMYSELKKKVILLSSTRVWRTYRGGKKLEIWEGLDNPKDSEFPEEWVASVVNIRNPEREHIKNEGLSKIKLEGYEDLTLKEVIESDPEAFLGKEHFEKYGTNTGVLIKIIDSLGRLTIQVHPDKKFALEEFNSNYGKTESWYILGGRQVDGESPYILLGFKEGVTKEKWKTLFENQDIDGMINCLNKIEVLPGEVYFIEGGVPHAIGSGCFLIEVQEPTDYTIRLERKTTDGNEISDFLCHQGLGFEKMFDCFHYESLSLEHVLNRWSVSPKVLFKNDDAEEWVLIGKEETNLFGLNKIVVNNSYKITSGSKFSVLVVVSGEGKIVYEQGEQYIKQGDFLFIPAGLGHMEVIAFSNIKFELARCFPPR
jgi:mannose-6-phosphate isomerase